MVPFGKLPNVPLSAPVNKLLPVITYLPKESGISLTKTSMKEISSISSVKVSIKTVLGDIEQILLESDGALAT